MRQRLDVDGSNCTECESYASMSCWESCCASHDSHPMFMAGAHRSTPPPRHGQPLLSRRRIVWHERRARRAQEAEEVAELAGLGALVCHASLSRGWFRVGSFVCGGVWVLVP